MDQNLFYAINNFAEQSRVIDLIGVFFAEYLIYALGLFLIWLWLKPEYRWKVYLGFGAALVNRGIIVEVLKRLVHRIRPYEILNVHQLIADKEHGVSFPSGHAAILFSFAFAFWGTKYFWPLFILATIGSLARVFVGLHYPTDILVGALIGAVLTLVYHRLFKNHILS